LAVVHDLDLARKSFDQALLLRTRVIAYGAASTVLNDAEIQAAYDGAGTVSP
jgi:ABC-type Mn2+/Zn2+ transport system ATPase subunit